MKSIRLLGVWPISIHSIEDDGVFPQWRHLLILDGDRHPDEQNWRMNFTVPKRAFEWQFPSWFLRGLSIRLGSGSARILDRPASSEAFYLNGKFYYRRTGNGKRLSYKRKVDGIRRLVLEVIPVVDAEHVSIINEALTRELHENETAILETINNHKSIIHDPLYPNIPGGFGLELLRWTQCSSIFRLNTASLAGSSLLSTEWISRWC